MNFNCKTSRYFKLLQFRSKCLHWTEAQIKERGVKLMGVTKMVKIEQLVSTGTLPFQKTVFSSF